MIIIRMAAFNLPVLLLSHNQSAKIILMHIKKPLKARGTDNMTNVCWDGMNNKQTEIAKPSPQGFHVLQLFSACLWNMIQYLENMRIMGIF